MNFKTCTGCGKNKKLNKKNFQWRPRRQVWEAKCKVCKSNNSKNYYKLNKSRIINNVTSYYELNKDYKKQYGISYYENNKTSIKFIKTRKVYYKNNKENINLYRKNYWKSRRKTDINYRLKANISNAVYKILKNDKANLSVKKYLPYKIKELREHIEKQFEISGNEWMTWDNWGIYNPKTWDDNDKSTWTWQLDHIIPKIYFKYKSMKDENFRKCWSLNNLQPLSSKENIKKGKSRK